MIFVLTVLAVLFAASTFFSFLTLACMARIRRDQADAIAALIAGHNRVAQRVTALNESVENAMDCMVTLDAHQPESQSKVAAATTPPKAGEWRSEWGTAYRFDGQVWRRAVPDGQGRLLLV